MTLYNNITMTKNTEYQFGQNKTTQLIDNILENIYNIGIDKIFDQTYGNNNLSVKQVNKIKIRTIQVFKNETKQTLINTFFDTVNLPLKYEELKILEERYKNRNETWRPPGNPEDHCRSARIESILKLKKEIDVLIQMQLVQIKSLKDKIEKAKIDNPGRLNKEISNRIASCLSIIQNNESNIIDISQPSILYAVDFNNKKCLN